MDRSHFLITTLIAAGMSVALLGCEQGPSGEYRTFSEAQLEEQQAAIEDESQEMSPGDSVDITAASEDSDASTTPIEPELAPEPTPATSDDDAAGDETIGVETAVEETSGDETSDDAKADDERLALTTDDSAAGSLADLSLEADEPRNIKLLVPDKAFPTEGPEQAVRVSYDDLDLLKVLNMEPVPEDAASHFPPWLSSLDGERLRIRGFMYPTFQATELTGFVLARDNEICCFGRNPKIYDLIEVSMRGGVTTDYIQGRPFDVVGQLHIRPEWDSEDQKLVRLYQIDDAVVINR